MSEMVLLSDPQILRMPVSECDEPLVDLRDVDALRLDGRLADPQGLFARVRLGLVDRLVTAQTLLPAGLRLLIVECFRPPALQARYFADHVDRLRRKHPDHDDAWLYRAASRYISPPEVAPHVAGAAVDLTLCTVDGMELEMGTSVNQTDDGLCHTASTAIQPHEADNRRILCKVLETVGLVNYPTEWWHWSYGDRYWAYKTGAAAAKYGVCSLH